MIVGRFVGWYGREGSTTIFYPARLYGFYPALEYPSGAADCRITVAAMEMIKRLTELFERLTAELPPETASLNVRYIQGGQGTVVELRPANPACAAFSVHVEDGHDLIDLGFGRATWEFPYERRYRNGEKDIITEIEEMARAVIAGNCEVRRRLFWTTSCIHVNEYTYGVSDLPVFSIPPFGMLRYAPYVSGQRRKPTSI